MAEDAQLLAQQTLTGGATQDTLYTVPASTQTIIKNITFVNFHASTAAWVKVWVGGSATSNLLHEEVSLEADGGLLEFTGTLTLEAAQTLVVEAENASSITANVFGVELT